MRKIRLILLTTAIMVFISSFGIFAHAATAKDYMVRSNDVKVYSKASTSSKLVGYVLNGAKVEGTKTVKKGSSVFVYCKVPVVYKDTYGKKIKKKSAKGYIAKKKLEEYYEEKLVKTATKVYSKKSTSSSKTSIKEGVIVKVLKSDSTWSKIKYNGKTKYIKSANLAARTGYITDKSVTARKTTSPKSPAVKTFKWNKKVTILSEYTSGSKLKYYRIKSGSKTALIPVKGSDGTVKVGSNIVMIANKATAIKKTASDSAKTVKSLNKNAEVTVNFKGSVWSNVTVGKNTGFVKNADLSSKTCSVNGPYYKSASKMASKTKAGTKKSSKATLIAKNEKLDFAYVSIGSSKYYVNASSLSDSRNTNTMYVAANNAILETAACSSKSGKYIQYMTKVTYYGVEKKSTDGDWLKVGYDGKVYYVWQKKGKQIFTDKKSDFSYTTSNKYQKEVMDLAMEIATEWKTAYKHYQSDGVPHDGVYGFDCSGYVTFTMKKALAKYNPAFDITDAIKDFPYVEYVQNKGLPGEVKVTKVSRDNLKAGDVVFFDLEVEATGEKGQDGKIDHCGFYIGNNEFVHANTTYNVSVSTLTDIYDKGYVWSKRYIPSSMTEANVEKTVKDYTGFCPTMKYDSTARKLKQNDKVTVLYTNLQDTSHRGDWAYVIDEKTGEKGFVLLSKLS